MGKTDSMSRHSKEEKSGIEARFFDKGQLLDIKEDDRE